MAEASRAQTRHPKEWVSNFKRDLEPFIKTQRLRKPRRPILRVGSRLRETWREHFEPQHISLGLYNRSSSDGNNPKTRGSIFRLAVVGAFLAESRMTFSDWENVCRRIVEDPEAMLEEYNEEGLDDLSIEEVRSVLSLDAIFLACFFSSIVDIGLHSQLVALFPSIINVLHGESYNFRVQLRSDILKLENQIPLVVIQKALLILFEIINEKSRNKRLEPTGNTGDVRDHAQTQRESDVLQLICTNVATFRHGLPGDPKKSNFLFEDKCKHLLHCVYLKLVSNGSDQTNADTYRARGIGAGPDRLLYEVSPSNPHYNQTDDPTDNASAQSNSEFSPLASASQLRKAGINFRGHAGLDVSFKKHILGATLFLPRILYFGDDCEQNWRNLLAFEVEHELGNQFVSYLAFMDELIDLEEDVELLRRGSNPVIANIGVGSNAEVARIFNSMTTGYAITSSENWRLVRRKVLDYYNNKNRHLWVEFRRTKFGKPWLFASLLAAGLLLISTFLQAYYTILTYYHTS